MSRHTLCSITAQTQPALLSLTILSKAGSWPFRARLTGVFSAPTARRRHICSRWLSAGFERGRQLVMSAWPPTQASQDEHQITDHHRPL